MGLYKCNSVSIISSFPYSVKFGIPESVILKYIKIYRRELTNDLVKEYLLYLPSVKQKISSYDIIKRMEFLISIFDLDKDHSFNVKLSPSDIIELYKIIYQSDRRFVDIISRITGDKEIFCGEDLDECIKNNVVLECRSFKIFEVLYNEPSKELVYE